MSVCEVMPGLWLGNIKIAQNLSFFETNNIHCVINCSKDIPFYCNKCENIRISVNDDLKISEINKLYEYFDKAADFINSRLLDNKNILVHCYAGKQRSASIIVVYLMKYCDLSLKNSIIVLKSKREIVFTPTINFRKSLLKYEKKIN
jgi:protein-tyrosine phosphatase